MSFRLVIVTTCRRLRVRTPSSMKGMTSPRQAPLVGNVSCFFCSSAASLC